MILDPIDTLTRQGVGGRTMEEDDLVDEADGDYVPPPLNENVSIDSESDNDDDLSDESIDPEELADLADRGERDINHIPENPDNNPAPVENDGGLGENDDDPDICEPAGNDDEEDEVPSLTDEPDSRPQRSQRVPDQKGTIPQQDHHTLAAKGVII